MSQKHFFRFMHLTDDALSDLRAIEKDEDGVGGLVIHQQYGARRSTPSAGSSEKAWTIVGSSASPSSMV